MKGLIQMEWMMVRVGKENSNFSQKKKYINSFFNTLINSSRKDGFFKKFSKALGFKETDEYTPEDILVENFFVYHEGNYFMEFYFPKRGYVRGSEVTISHFELTKKWNNFLNKIFPDLITEILEKEMPSCEKIFVTSTILKTIEDYPISTSISLSREIDKETLETLNATIQNLNMNLNHEIEQYYCNVCFSNNPNKPIHLEFQTSLID